MSPVDAEDLVFATDVRNAGGDPRDLRYAAQRRELIRVRRGAYCRRDRWEGLSERDRHLLLIHAVHRQAQTPGIVAGLSAAAVWGIPIAGHWPTEVTLLSQYRGGGKSERGVRRTSVAFNRVGPHWFGELPVTSLERTAIDLARTLPFAKALACVDGILLHPQALGADAIAAELERMPLRAGTAKVARVLEHASSMSGSVGESEARGVIIELGFEPPELQVEFVDSDGRIIPDFYWRGVNIAGEFDGKIKFTRSEYTHGDPGEVAWREKKREDRLRRNVAGVVRILTEHVKNPPSLARLLVEAGVPRLGRGPTYAVEDRRVLRSRAT